MTNCKLLLVCLLLLFSLPVHAAGKIEKRSYFFKEAGKEIDYRLYVPSSYTKEIANPLIVIPWAGAIPQVIRYNGVVQEAESRGYIALRPNVGGSRKVNRER